MKSEIISIIIDHLKEIGDNQQNNALKKVKPSTPLYGRNGIIDSLSLVMLVAEVEESIEERFKEMITLVDEKAMSQKKSPFRSAEALAEYILELINKNE